MPARDPNTSPHHPVIIDNSFSSHSPLHASGVHHPRRRSSVHSGTGHDIHAGQASANGNRNGNAAPRRLSVYSHDGTGSGSEGAATSGAYVKRRGMWKGMTGTGASSPSDRESLGSGFSQTDRAASGLENDSAVDLRGEVDNGRTTHIFGTSYHAISSNSIRDETARLASLSYSPAPSLSSMDGLAVTQQGYDDIGGQSFGGAGAKLVPPTPEIPSQPLTPRTPAVTAESSTSVTSKSSTPLHSPAETPKRKPSNTLPDSPKLDEERSSYRQNQPSSYGHGSAPSGLSVMLERNSRSPGASASNRGSPRNGRRDLEDGSPGDGSRASPPTVDVSSNNGPSKLLGEDFSVEKDGEGGPEEIAKDTVGAVGSAAVSAGSGSSVGEVTPKAFKVKSITSSSSTVTSRDDDSPSASPPRPANLPKPLETESLINERTPLIAVTKPGSETPHSYEATSSSVLEGGRKETKANIVQRARDGVVETFGCIRKATIRDVLDALVKQPVITLPAVILGLLLNVLDGVSYGMILFPASYVFTDYGSIGVSMFFVSCIVSQLTYSLGGSIFKGGNGSMMIEAVPFFHILVNIISEVVGETNSAAIIATTMASFAFSAILTGIVFMSLGAFRLGALIGYFPRHILVGCIGGVGIFLIETGLEVSLGLKEEGFEYNLTTLKMFISSGHAIALWTIPLALAICLRIITHYSSNQYIFPTYFLSIPVVFYIVVAIGGWDFARLRGAGWIFDVGRSTQPWYKFYTLFDFRHFSWKAFYACIPTQMALVFFGILHVPLNVPSLGVTLSEDNVNLDRELVAHGVSNIAAGLLGTVPNYLCYVNTVLFYRVPGGGSRLSGVMLAAATAVMMFLGPSVIGYLPVAVVGALIFVLGIDLVKEAVWDTRHRVNRWEYITIWAIAIGMTIFDFVLGLLLGIILASLFFVVQNSRRRAIRAVFDGSAAKSTVRRPHAQRAFLQDVGKQTIVMKLQGFLFFGTITKVEDEVKKLLDIAAWERNPIRFLIVDFALVTGLDYSSAEAFVRLQRLLDAKDVLLVLCGADPKGLVGSALRAVDLWADQEGTTVEVFDNLNDALEWSENSYLAAFYSSVPALKKETKARGIDLPKMNNQPFFLNESFENSPRRSHLAAAGRTALPVPDLHLPSPAVGAVKVQDTLKQPLAILMQTLSAYTDEGHAFFYQLVPYFQSVIVKQGDIIWKQGDEPDGLFIIEDGCLHAVYHYEDHSEFIHEMMMAHTVAGEMTMLSGTKRNATVSAERDSHLWKLDNEGLAKLEKEKPTIARQFVKIAMKVAAEEADVLASHLVAVLS